MRMEVEYLGRSIGSVEVPGPVGSTVKFQLKDGTLLIMSVSRPFKAHNRRVLARLTKLEKIRLIPSFVEYP